MTEETISCPNCSHQTNLIIVTQGGQHRCPGCAAGHKVDHWLTAGEFVQQQIAEKVDQALFEGITSTADQNTQAIDPTDQKLIEDLLANINPENPFVKSILGPPDDLKVKMPSVSVPTWKDPNPANHPPVTMPSFKASCPVQLSRPQTVTFRPLAITFDLYWDGDRQRDIFRIWKDPQDFDEALISVQIDDMLRRQRANLAEKLTLVMLKADGWPDC